MMFNLVQAVIAVFLSSDFARRDKNLDTAKVIYARSVSNTEYFIGKTLGILYVFLILNILVMGEALIFNATSKLININFFTYMIYPLLISLPTVVFIIGLSYIFMTITKNQAITFILLIAYIAINSFYLGTKMNYLLDFMAYRVPLGYSDFIEFGNINEILIHRGIYVFLGLGLIFLSIRFMDRLPQSRLVNIILAISILFIGGGFYLSGKYLMAIKEKNEIREQAISINNKYYAEPVIDIEEYHIKVRHLFDYIRCTARIKYENPTDHPLSEIILSLNSGLKVSGITSGEKNVPFKREGHVIIISREKPLQPGEKDSMAVVYKGTPEERTCYLDVDTSSWNDQFKMFLLNIDNRYGITTPDYLMLTNEMNWYPKAGVGYNTINKFKQNTDFAKYTLQVKTSPKLTVISQGEQIKHRKGEYIFKSEYPLPQISLTIGDYEKLSINIDSVEYALYRKKGHNYWTQHFTELGDTVGYVLKELLGDYERKLGLQYPYKRYYLVETPVQFSCHPRLNTVAWEYSQPEILYVPENGFMLFNADFRQMEFNRRFNDRNKDKSDKEKQIIMFKRGFNSSFATGTAFIRTKTRQGEISNYFSIFPSYYTHTYHINSNEWPIINLAIESYYNSRIKGQMNTFFSRMSGLTADEKSNLYLQKESMQYYVEHESNIDKVMGIVNIKGTYLFTLIKDKIGYKKMDQFLGSFLESNCHSSASFNQLLNKLEDNYRLDLLPVLDNWYKSSELPLYAFDQGEYYKVMSDNKEMNQIIFRITNQSEIDGVFTVTLENDQGRRGFQLLSGYGNDADNEYIYNLKAGETKEIGLLLADRPRSYYVNTVVSQNTPSSFHRFTQKFETKENGIIFDGERVIDKRVEFVHDNEIVVDNIDKGFRLVEPESNKFIKNLFEPKENPEFDYVNFNWEPQGRWLEFIDSEVYGRTIHSAYYTKPGKGDYKAIWTAKLPESGKYEVYTFIVGRFVNHGHGRGRQRNRDGAFGEFIYTIHHDDGDDKVPVTLKDIEPGWQYLGDFYFSADSASIELSNKGEAPMIITADAVKWVKKK